MSNQFKSVKYQTLIAIYHSEKVEGVTSHRQRCMKRLMDEIPGTSNACASTYYANVKAHFTSGVTDTVKTVQRVVEKVVVKEELWSCVKLDEDDLAEEVMTFHNVDDALKYSQDNVMYLMRGTQRYNAELGAQAKYNEDGDEIDDDGVVIE